MNDQQRVVYAIREAQLILARFIEPGQRDANKTINELLAILDRNDVVESVDRLEVESGLKFRENQTRQVQFVELFLRVFDGKPIRSLQCHETRTVCPVHSRTDV